MFFFEIWKSWLSSKSTTLTTRLLGLTQVEKLSSPLYSLQEHHWLTQQIVNLKLLLSTVIKPHSKMLQITSSMISKVVKTMLRIKHENRDIKTLCEVLCLGTLIRWPTLNLVVKRQRALDDYLNLLVLNHATGHDISLNRQSELLKRLL